MITSAQKKEMKSLYVPIGGVPGWALRTVAKANSNAAVNENIASSTLRPRSTTLKVKSRTEIVNPHIITMTKSEKNLVVEAREIVMSIPTKSFWLSLALAASILNPEIEPAKSTPMGISLSSSSSLAAASVFLAASSFLGSSSAAASGFGVGAGAASAGYAAPGSALFFSGFPGTKYISR